MTFPERKAELEAQGWKFQRSDGIDPGGAPAVVWLISHRDGRWAQGWVTKEALARAEQNMEEMDALWLHQLETGKGAAQ